MDNLLQIARDLNTLGDFLAQRDLPSLTAAALQQQYGIRQADLLILFGATIIGGCDLAAEAFQAGIAKRLLIVGGNGHTTETLRTEFHRFYPALRLRQLQPQGTEAELIATYFNAKYGLTDLVLETRSTNCGNNITYALAVVKEQQLAARSIILIQDSTMQRRMDAGFQKLWDAETAHVINFAPQRATLEVRDGALGFAEGTLSGMWSVAHYITLVMGEIPRLRDDEKGYGPRGKDFIAHVSIPVPVEQAFARLQAALPGSVRLPNSAYRS